MDVLLLGGTGLLGEPAARALSAAGHAVTVLARGRRPTPEGVERIEADRRDTDSIVRALAGRRFDFTVDFLAYDAADIERLLLIPHAALGRLVTISTGQVYLVTEDPRPPFREEDADRPLIPEPEPDTHAWHNWVYGVGKRRMEAMLAGLRQTHRLRSMVLRLPVVQGAGDRTGRLWAYVERLRDGGPVIVPGSLDQPLRFVWAEDVARLLVQLAAEWPAAPAVVNVAQPDAITFREFLVGLAGELGTRATVVVCGESELHAAGLDAAVSPFTGRWCSVPDPTRLREELAFEATPFAGWLPEVVRALDARGGPGHPGYARRESERAFASSRTTSALS